MQVAIIGAGAAGCFCAINLKRQRPDAEITIYEAGRKPLAKVAVTGGGRCNLTNTFRQVDDYRLVYPRGDKLMKRALMRFSHRDTWEWFENEGVELTAQEDECVFPISQDAMQIVETLLKGIREAGINLKLGHKVLKVDALEDGRYCIDFASETAHKVEADHVVVCTGGHPSAKGFVMLDPLQLDIIPPIPSLFTLNIAGDWHQELMGIVVENASVMLAGTKLKSHGPLLLTHWGMSGPAILKLTSYGARILAEQGYKGQLLVNWYGKMTEEEVRREMQTFMRDYTGRQITTTYPRHLCARHWHHLIRKSHISETQRWGALNGKELNRLVTTLTADTYEITGKCRFKEEFVTCGGVSLKSININTLESKQHPGLYFAGEVLDVDAITGGFNLQAAWSMGYVISQEIAAK